MLRHEVCLEAIGTRWSITTDRELDASDIAAVRDVIDEYDLTWSRFRADSVVARIAREGGTHRLPPHAVPLLDLYDALHERTAGAVSPLVGRSLEVLGYDAGYSLRPSGDPVPAADWVGVHRDGATLSLDAPALLDVGAAGKGQLVDLVADCLRARHVREYLVDAGGDMVHRGDSPVRVALQQPGDPSMAVGVVELQDAALCGSAIDRRAWGDGLHHVLDARTGRPTHDVVATWVVAGSAMIADGLATALFFAEPDRLEVRFDLSYVQLRADGSARFSLGLPGRVFA